MKNKLFFSLLILFLFLINIPRVSATSIGLGDVEFTVNNTDLLSSNVFITDANHPSTFYASLGLYGDSNVKDVYTNFIYYFKSYMDDFVAYRSSTCNVSCFNSVSVYKIGKTQWNNDQVNLFALVVSSGKIDFGVGTSNIGIITDDIVIKSANSYTGVNGIEFIGASSSSDVPIFPSNIDYTGDLNLINDKITGLTNSLISSNQSIINNQNQNQQQTNNKLDGINNSLNDETGVPQNDVSNKTNEWSSKLAGTGPVSNMVLMPIILLNGYLNGFNSTCSTFNLGNLMGTDIILPCINISNYLGATLWNVIDILFSGFMIYAIGKKFVKIFNDFTNLRDNQMDELYGGGK